MSRYVRTRIRLAGLDAVTEALTALGIAFARNDSGVMLRGGLECAGEPVQVRVQAGVENAVEDFGFSVHEGSLELVCSEVDREVLAGALVPKLVAQAVEHRVADLPGVTVVRIGTKD